jgi:hypothetical protein
LRGAAPCLGLCDDFMICIGRVGSGIVPDIYLDDAIEPSCQNPAIIARGKSEIVAV